MLSDDKTKQYFLGLANISLDGGNEIKWEAYSTVKTQEEPYVHGTKEPPLTSGNVKLGTTYSDLRVNDNGRSLILWANVDCELKNTIWEFFDKAGTCEIRTILDETKYPRYTTKVTIDAKSNSFIVTTEK